MPLMTAAPMTALSRLVLQGELFLPRAVPYPAQLPSLSLYEIHAVLR
jgi:hypothetical protein